MKANGSLLYHKQITFLDIILARSLIEIAGSIMAFFLGILLFAGILKVVDFPQGNLVLLIFGWLLSAWYCLATAMIVGSITELSHLAEKLASVVGYINIPLCGAFWMVDWLPYWLPEYVVLIPSVSAYEMIRSGYFGYEVKSYYDPFASCGVCLLMTFLGLLLMQRARNHLAVE